jgi:hypothetical protein
MICPCSVRLKTHSKQTISLIAVILYDLVKSKTSQCFHVLLFLKQQDMKTLRSLRFDQFLTRSSLLSNLSSVFRLTKIFVDSKIFSHTHVAQNRHKQHTVYIYSFIFYYNYKIIFITQLLQLLGCNVTTSV